MPHRRTDHTSDKYSPQLGKRPPVKPKTKLTTRCLIPNSDVPTQPEAMPASRTPGYKDWNNKEETEIKKKAINQQIQTQKLEPITIISSKVSA